jgi:hypothetical protein
VFIEEIMMGKYEPLGQFLKKQKRSQIKLSFAEIEKIIGAKLPKSKSSRAFWSNNPDNNVMTKEWISAGFETQDVDTKHSQLVFSKKSTNLETAKEDKWESLFGCMKGMITFAPGFDPTSPAYSAEEWEEIEREWSENWDVLMQPFNQP